MNRCRYDFTLNYNNKNFIIEFDGCQHFKYTPYWHKTEDVFLYFQEIDKLKNNIGIISNYNVIRIYTSDEDKIVRMLDYFLNLDIEQIFIGIENLDKYSFIFKGFDRNLLDFNCINIDEINCKLNNLKYQTIQYLD